MGKEREKEKDQKEKKQMFVGVIWNCAAELKLLLSALLFLCSIITLLQFLPSRFFPLSVSVSDLRSPCLTTTTTTTTTSVLPPPPPPPPPLLLTEVVDSSFSHISTASVFENPVAKSITAPPPLTEEVKSALPVLLVQQDQIVKVENSTSTVVKRGFNAYGAAAYNFIQMGAYRGGINTFAVIALSSKPLQVYGKPSYKCEWISPNNPTDTPPVSVAGTKMLTDWGYGRVYTVVVINCTFPEPVGVDGPGGGKLVLYASSGGIQDRDSNLTDRIEALSEEPGSVSFSLYTSPPKYDYLYCGSPLYGNLSPQRMREWIAYHVRLFGPKSHFVIHDAGGVHEEVLEVLKPWMELGYVTLQDVREEERFDGYYHNQFLVVNDCLHRYKFMAKWMFFFDVDEFIYVQPKNTIKSVLDSLSEFTQFTIEQMPMSNKLCLSADAGKTHRRWGFEKLVYKDVKRGIRRDRKYAVQPRNVMATGVHLSQHYKGKTNHKTERQIKYFHYHGTISERRETCRTLNNSTQLSVDGIPYVMDTTMRSVAGTVKLFELKTIGPRLQKTRQ